MTRQHSTTRPAHARGRVYRGRRVLGPAGRRRIVGGLAAVVLVVGTFAGVGLLVAYFGL